MSREDFQARVLEIAGPRGWFQPLNPYASDDALFAIEDVNYGLRRDDAKSIVRDKDGSPKLDKSTIEPLFVLAVSAKRYALANRHGDDWIIRKASGHGTGHITAPGYDKKALPVHPAAPIDAKGEPDHGELSKCQAPKLICDLWRVAFGAASRGEDIQGAILDVLEAAPGLAEPQFTQHALSSRADWLAYEHLPGRRPFMFFSVLPAPISDGSLTGRFWLSDNHEMTKRRNDLFDTSLYARFSKDRIDRKSLRRSDNNQFPAEIFAPEYKMALQSVADCLHGYFDHSEMKSLGETGLLRRMRMVIFDHEYIGKETNALVDEELEDAGEERPEDLASIPIFRKGFNSSMLGSVDLSALAERIGVKPETLRDARDRGRRLDKSAMARLRIAIDVDGRSGALSIAKAAMLPADELRARRMAKQLRTLHGALAKGKDFDLNGPRRSAFLNKRRGAISFAELCGAIERHLTDKESRMVLAERIHKFWDGDADFRGYGERELEAIEKAIRLASGLMRSHELRRERRGASSAENFEKTARKQRARAARVKTMEAGYKAAMKRALAPNRVAIEGALAAAGVRSPIDDLTYVVVAVLGVLLIGHVFVNVFPREVESAHKAAFRRATPETFDAVFLGVFCERIENRNGRRELDRLRKRLARRGFDERDHGAGGVIDKSA